MDAPYFPDHQKRKGTLAMDQSTKMIDRAIGRNAEMLAQALTSLSTEQERYPYIRVLVGLVEQARPEMAAAPTKDALIAKAILHLSKGALNQAEVAEVVRIRDAEQGIVQEGKPLDPPLASALYREKAQQEAAAQAQQAAEATEVDEAADAAPDAQSEEATDLFSEGEDEAA